MKEKRFAVRIVTTDSETYIYTTSAENSFLAMDKVSFLFRVEYKNKTCKNIFCSIIDD